MRLLARWLEEWCSLAHSLKKCCSFAYLPTLQFEMATGGLRDGLLQDNLRRTQNRYGGHRTYGLSVFLPVCLLVCLLKHRRAPETIWKCASPCLMRVLIMFSLVCYCMYVLYCNVKQVLYGMYCMSLCNVCPHQVYVCILYMSVCTVCTVPTVL